MACLADSLHHSWPSVRALMRLEKLSAAACIIRASRILLHVASVAALSSFP